MTRRKPDSTPAKRAELNPWFNSREAAAHTGLAEETLRKAVSQRELTVRRSGDRGPFYIKLSELERWFAWRFKNVTAAVIY